MKRTDELALKALELYRTGEYTHPTLAIRLNYSKWMIPALLKRGQRVEERIEEQKNSYRQNPEVIERGRKAIKARKLHESLLNLRAIALAYQSITAALNPASKAPPIED